MKNQSLTRRHFLHSTVAAGAGLTILPSGVLSGQNAPSNKLNIALIGAYGRATAHYDTMSAENVTAICDINEKHLDIAAKRFPKAKRYVDWRKCLEQKDLDAVVCCTLDHTHAFVSIWAMNRGLHVYCEKPLANTVNEARLVRETYLKHKGSLATQCGTQRHAFENFNRVRELVHDGAIGELKAVHAWGDRQIRRDGYLPAKGEPPKHLHFDLWLGPSPFHPYNPDYFSGQPGANCLQWNMYWDFGSGQVGDMGSHTMELAWNVIDAGLPVSAEAEGDKYNPQVTPVELKAKFTIPANSWREEIPVIWYQGGAMPGSPHETIDLNKIGHGVLFKGSQGYLVSGFQNRILFPFGDSADMTYYNRRPKEKILPPMGGFQQEWIDACKGDKKTSCDFEYSGNLIEMMLLGLVAYRVGKKLDYDPVSGTVTNSSEGENLLGKQYREGWTLNG
ncbi:Gfo/Idh/MocA family oxidoreductase [candidate division KSB1 bacterium]|nr:Gfo/Idh/MocA family oxidoreductase [candidate division KSB1 bacterium]